MHFLQGNSSCMQPTAFPCSILTDQGAVSTQSPFLYLPPSLPLLFLLSYLSFFFSLPLCDVAFVQGFKIQIGCVIQPDRLAVPCRDKRRYVRRTCSRKALMLRAKRAYTRGVGISNIMRKSIYLLTTTPTSHTHRFTFFLRLITLDAA